MNTIERILIDGLTASIPFAIVIWITFLTKPRLWLHSLPADIQAMVPAKTAQEERLTGLMGIFVLLTFFGIPIVLTWRWRGEQAAFSFGAILAQLYGVWMVVNLWDLILIDWVYTALVNPDNPPIPGTAGAAGYKDYAFHLRAFFKASVFSLAILIPAAAALTWL